MVTLLDYYVKENILKNKLDDDSSIYDPKTKWFRNQTETEQDKIMSDAKDKWWEEYGKDYMNSMYNDEIIGSKVLGRDISKWFVDKVVDNIEPLTKKLLGNYSNEFRKDLINLIDDWSEHSKESDEKIEQDLSDRDKEMRLERVKQHLINVKLEDELWSDYYTQLKGESGVEDNETA
tara:strand:+ start:548 stop:1078 length:531 start_codon:yes stop_codon:yes gene_type:complete